MKTHLTSCLIAVLLLGLSAGCGDRTVAAPPEASQPAAAASTASSQAPAPSATERASVAIRQIVGEAWEKSKDATFRQREALRDRMKTAEKALDARIVEWNARKDALAEDVRPLAAAAHREVIEAREVLRQKIDALDNATQETWPSVKAELSTAWQRMTAAVADLNAKLQS
jgi:hypothetical protein